MTNKELDKEMAKLMGWQYLDVVKMYLISQNPDDYKDENDWHPTESISDAFQVVEKIHETWIFSKRQAFLKALQEVVSNGIVELTKSKQMIAWPDLLFYITPKAICLAAKKSYDPN